MVEITEDLFPHVHLIGQVLRAEAPFLSSVIDKQLTEFGADWLQEFEGDLATFFDRDQEALTQATMGYIEFAFDGMLLQKRFDKTGHYEPKSYEQAAAEVYQNAQYMNRLYLPGIYLSHFLWRHHFIQHRYFLRHFIPKVLSHAGSTYYDVGVGTGFYLREMLRLVPRLKGHGFDLSASSLAYTERMVKAFGLQDRCTLTLNDVVANPPAEKADFLTNVEVLEHLEDPLAFLKGLRILLKRGGLGMITAAVTAPNADHIYLYHSVDDLVSQVVDAGFEVIDSREDMAYTPKRDGESVPRNAIVLVS